MLSSTRFRDWLLLLACNLIWASQFVMVKLVQERMGPVFATFFPMTIATLLLIPIVRREKRVPVRRADIAGFVLLGLGQVCAQLLITWGVKLSLASNAALLMLTLPVSTAVIAYFLLGERMSAVRWVSFAFAIAGVVACSANDLRGLNLASGAYLLGNLLIFASVNGSAFYNTYSKRMLERYSPLQVLLYSYYVVFAFMLPAALYSEPRTFLALPHFGPVVWVGLFILAVFQYFLSMVIFLNVLTRLDATQAALSNYLIPFFGVVLAAAILHERLTATMIAGGVLVLASTLLATLHENRRKIALAVALLALAASPCRAEKIQYHDVKVDSTGRIVPWYGSGPSEAYDFVVRQVFKFWTGIRNCPNGVPVYLQHQVWKADEDDPRGLGGDQIPMALSSWNLLYGYLGDEAVRKNMVFQADYWLAHGMSGPDVLWANLPYPYNTDLHSGVYDGDMRAGKGFVQPDKAASFAAELIVLYKMTGEAKYLDAAMGMANTLAAQIQPGDADHSPWPYRLNAKTGAVHTETDKGKTYAATYTSNYTGALRMFDDLIALEKGNTKDYARAAGILAVWLKRYPIATNKWGPFFEDIPTSVWTDTEHNADTMAMYILEHPSWDPDWKRTAKGILDWSLGKFANREYEKWGVTAINEQTCYQVPGNSHTSRHASVELLYCEKTGDLALKEDAIRRLNWATYTVDSDGKNRYIRDDNWLTDGYGDYVRHYLRAMASMPELAPANQNHLLRTSSVVRSIGYGADRITYKKFDAASTERFKLGAWAPKSVQGGDMQWDAKSKVLTVKATAKTVVISGQ